MKIPLAESASGVFNAAGKVTVSMGPAVYGSSWSIDRASVSSTSLLDSECSMYRGLESPNTLIDGTSSGNGDTNDVAGNPILVSYGQVVVFVWTGGTPGAIATAVLDGTKETGR